MILYVNGDSHTAAAECVNSFAFAEDDGNLYHLGRQPHPDNLKHSWGKLLANSLNCALTCQAESASSNSRILRTTREWLKHNSHVRPFIIIQWSTWEREEWLIDETYYQVNSSGIDIVPQQAQEKYRQYILGIDWQQKTQEAHSQIWQLHTELQSANIPHVFFNGNNHFEQVDQQYDWGVNYIGPYDITKTYNQILLDANINPVTPKSYHFGTDGHQFFSKFLYDYIITNKLI